MTGLSASELADLAGVTEVEVARLVELGIPVAPAFGREHRLAGHQVGDQERRNSSTGGDLSRPSCRPAHRFEHGGVIHTILAWEAAKTMLHFAIDGER